MFPKRKKNSLKKALEFLEGFFIPFEYECMHSEREGSVNIDGSVVKENAFIGIKRIFIKKSLVDSFVRFRYLNS